MKAPIVRSRVLCNHPSPPARRPFLGRRRWRLPRPGLLLVGVGLAMLRAAPLSCAATSTWAGGYPLSVNDDWTTPNNWVGQSVPASGADTALVFGATTSGGTNRTNPNNNIADPFVLGSLTFTASAPAYTLSGGALQLVSGGLVQNSANAQTINNIITVGADQSWSFGSGAGALNLGAAVSVSHRLSLGSGTVNVTSSDFNIDDSTGSGAASVTLSGATLSAAQNVNVGVSGTGSVTQSAGSLAIPQNHYLYLGRNGGIGTYTFSGGSLSTGIVAVGDYGAGIFTQSGGTFTTNGRILYLGPQSGDGSYNLSGGSLTTGRTQVGDRDNTSTFTQSGGTHATGILSITGLNTLSLGSYHLAGGILQAGQVTSGDGGVSGTSTFNFEGGTLQATANNSAFFQGVTTANVRAGGARIDTNGFDITIAQALVHDTTTGAPALDAGLTKLGAGTLTLTGANTYTGGTTIAAGTLSVSSDALLGAASSPLTVNSGAALQFTSANVTTARSVVLSGTVILAPASGGTLTYASGALVSGGRLGAGSHFFSNGSGLIDSHATSGAVLSQTASGTVAFTDVTLASNSTFTQPAGATLNSTGDFITTASSTVTLSGIFNTTGGSLTGALIINNGGRLNESGSTTPLYLDGSRGVTINSGGQLNAATGSTIELGGLLTNNGTQTGQLNINLGAIVRGSGTFGSVHVTATGSFGATGTITGSLVVDSGALVTLNGAGALTVNGAVTNNGVMRFERGAQLAVANSAGFTNNGTLDVITGGFQVAAQGGFINNGLVLDSSVVRVKTFAYSPGGPVQVQIDGYPGHTYQLQRSNSLVGGSFAAVPGVAAQSTPDSNPGAVLLAFADPSPAAGMGFYRVAVDP